MSEVALVWGDYGILGDAAAYYTFGLYGGDSMGTRMASPLHEWSSVSLGCISGSVHGRFCCTGDRWFPHQRHVSHLVVLGQQMSPTHPAPHAAVATSAAYTILPPPAKCKDLSGYY